MAELIKMPFGMWTRVGIKNYVLDGGPDPPVGRGTFEGMTSGFPRMPSTTVPIGRPRSNEISPAMQPLVAIL